MNAFHLRLPATSANLGPAFDTAALALALFLDIRAELADAYSIHASGRNTDVCSRLHRNLMLAVYEDTLRSAGQKPHPLALDVVNEIPIGMGCGSSAAARLAGVCLADHFGELRWSNDRILQEACRLEGHPDNAAACWLGGFTVAAGAGDHLQVASVNPPSGWAAILVLPDQPLSTSAARAILPATYSRPDAVHNVQNTALLMAAFYSARPDLLRHSMADFLHQPYRSQVCPLLPLLLPLAGQAGVLGIALSGAGPSVLAIVDATNVDNVKLLIRKTLESAPQAAELLHVRLGRLYDRSAATMGSSIGTPVQEL